MSEMEKKHFNTTWNKFITFCDDALPKELIVYKNKNRYNTLFHLITFKDSSSKSKFFPLIFSVTNCPTSRYVDNFDHTIQTSRELFNNIIKKNFSWDITYMGILCGAIGLDDVVSHVFLTEFARLLPNSMPKNQILIKISYKQSNLIVQKQREKFGLKKF